MCESRLWTLQKQKWTTNNPQKEKRGGARTKPEYRALRKKIEQHITYFRCVSSHYCCRKMPHKRYLPSQLMLTGGVCNIKCSQLRFVKEPAKLCVIPIFLTGLSRCTLQSNSHHGNQESVTKIWKSNSKYNGKRSTTSISRYRCLGFYLYYPVEI